MILVRAKAETSCSSSKKKISKPSKNFHADWMGGREFVTSQAEKQVWRTRLV